MTHDKDPDPDEYDSHRMRDVLDRETIDQIEELHGAVVRAEAEQRFGLLRGKRTRQVAEAEAAEQAFLNAQGFATYNDFRLRIRRSTALHGEQPAPAWTEGLGFEDGFEPLEGFDAGSERGDDVGTTPPAATMPELTRDSDSDEGANVAPDDDVRSQEGSEQMGPLPESAPALAGPPPVPSFAPRGDADTLAPAAADFRRLTEPLFATLQAETDRFVASRVEAAEKQAADIVNRASKEAAEIIGRAARMHDAVKSLVEDVGRQSEAFLDVTEAVSNQIGRARETVATDLQALRDLAESAPGKGGPGAEPARAVPAAEPANVWAAPQRISPPPPMSSIAPAGD